MKQNETLMGSGALLLAAVIWGFGYVVISDSLNLVDVSYLMAYRYILAALGMAAVFWKHLPSINRSLLKEGAVLGLLLYLSQYAQTVACGYTTAGKVSFITALYVVLVPICGLCGFQQKMNRNHWIAVLLALPGLFLLTQAGGGICAGDLLALAGSFGFAVHILFSDRFAQRDSVILLSLLQFSWAAVYSTAVLLISGRPLLLEEISWTVGSRLIFMGIISTLTGFFLQMWGQKRVSPSLAAMLLATEALFGLLFSAMLLHETVTPIMALGGALMLAAILVAERAESK